MNKITCIGGKSGSGKSSLAFATLYSESRRRFLNSFPTSLQLFTQKEVPADVDNIHPVLPVVGLKQSNPIKGKKLNVADVSGLSDLIEAFFQTHAKELCPEHLCPLEKTSRYDQLQSFLQGMQTGGTKVHLFAYQKEFLKKYTNPIYPLRSMADESSEISDFNRTDLLWEIARFKTGSRGQLPTSFDSDVLEGINLVKIYFNESTQGELVFHKSAWSCPSCHYESSYAHRERLPRLFSAFSPLGACIQCRGFGSTLEYTMRKIIPDHRVKVKNDGVRFLKFKKVQRYKPLLLAALKEASINIDDEKVYSNKQFKDILMNGGGKFPGIRKITALMEKKIYRRSVRIFLSHFKEEVLCKSCNGSRIKKENLNFYVDNISLELILNSSFNELSKVLKNKKSFVDLLKYSEMACDLGLGHLKLKRKAWTLSSSEHQRCLLLKNLSFKGCGNLFVFDEPSLGLGEPEQEKFCKYLKVLTQNKNTVLLIEHSSLIKSKSDYYVEMGPGAGPMGGEIIFTGKFKLKKEKSYKKKNLKKTCSKKILVQGLQIFDLPEKSISLQKNTVNLITGPNGCGKTAYLIHCLANFLSKKINGELLTAYEGSLKKLSGHEDIKQTMLFSAEFLRPSSRSTLGTYLGFVNILRKYFTSLPLSKALELKEGHFSSNSELGRCSVCMGAGYDEIDMHFLDNMRIPCDYCDGTGFKKEVLEVRDNGLSIYDSLQIPVGELFKNVPLTPKFRRLLSILKDLSLDYLSLNRNLNTLSGGEFQRLRLVKILEKTPDQGVLFIENISFGLSASELEKVFGLLEGLSGKNTIILIDHSTYFSEQIPSEQQIKI